MVDHQCADGTARCSRRCLSSIRVRLNKIDHTYTHTRARTGTTIPMAVAHCKVQSYYNVINTCENDIYICLRGGF